MGRQKKSIAFFKAHSFFLRLAAGKKTMLIAFFKGWEKKPCS
jgi:hypothetical protein